MSKKKPSIAPSELNRMALDLIASESTLALATVDPQTLAPWSAPVYYVFAKTHFYFVSSPTSRHIEESRDAAVAATLYARAASWEDIRGLQMSGTIRRLGTGKEALQAVALYLKKYPFTRQLFKPASVISPTAFWDQFKVRLYAFEADLVYYLDNKIRFGFREEIQL